MRRRMRSAAAKQTNNSRLLLNKSYGRGHVCPTSIYGQLLSEGIFVNVGRHISAQDDAIGVHAT